MTVFFDVSLFPDQASTLAPEVDGLYFFLNVLSAFFTLLIVFLVAYFSFKYRRRTDNEYPTQPIKASYLLELTWVAVPLLITLFIFGWSASLYSKQANPPAGAMDVYVVGKRWMWKFQHIGGQSEINELHVPIGQPVRLTMTSQDVIHSFFVPAFRVKADVRPGTYSTTWFHATKPGTYHLFCAEYCGTKHAGMIGRIVVMTPADYQAWLNQSASGVSLTDSGEQLFQSLHCQDCHRADGRGQGPVLNGIFGTSVRLQTGETILVDETYVRESILNPQAKVAAGYQPVMPSYAGQVSEEDLIRLVDYIKNAKAAAQNPGGATP